jgi:hypothetical protein
MIIFLKWGYNLILKQENRLGGENMPTLTENQTALQTEHNIKLTSAEIALII